jgi:hypothetical protein
MGCHTEDIMEKRDGAFVFKKKDLEIDLEDGTQYVVNPKMYVCTRYHIVQTEMVKNSICITQKIMEDQTRSHRFD